MCVCTSYFSHGKAVLVVHAQEHHSNGLRDLSGAMLEYTYFYFNLPINWHNGYYVACCMGVSKEPSFVVMDIYDIVAWFL